MFVPWRPHYTRDQAAMAIQEAETWLEVLEELGYAYHGKNILTLRKWAKRWGISVAHLPHRAGIRRASYSMAEAREAIAESRSWAEALRRLGYCQSGGNPRTLQKRAAQWGIPTNHFDPAAASREAIRHSAKPLKEILVEGSTYSRANLKRRLYEEGLKERRCELCRQGEIWRGERIGLILDHVNGVRDDNRLENLRIVCPNCAATLDTHCGRGNRIPLRERSCLRCGHDFMPRSHAQRYCSRECGTRWKRTPAPRVSMRRTHRPGHATLLREVEQHGYSAVGRRYGVSDNAVRKWVRQYEREKAFADGRNPDDVEIPTRTWPNQRDR